MLTFHFSGADGSMIVEETLTSGMVGKEVKLEFSSDWDGLTKTAVFMAGDVIRDVAGVSDIVVIPAEVLTSALQQLYVGVYGVSADGSVTPTIRAAGPWILPGVDPSGDEGTDPDLPVWAQMQVQIDDLNASKSSYYWPIVTQPEDHILQFSWKPSNNRMPLVPPVSFILSDEASDAVRYAAQELTADQQNQARTNIGSAKAAFVTQSTRYTVEGGDGDAIADKRGRINTSGVFEATNTFAATDFVAVNADALIHYCIQGYAGISAVAFYDEARAYLSGVTTDATATLEGTVTAPQGAAFVRFTFLAGETWQYATVVNTKEIDLSGIGDIDRLETTDRTSLVAAINEAVKAGVSAPVTTVTKYTSRIGGGDVPAAEIGYIDTSGVQQWTDTFDCTDYIAIDQKSVIEVSIYYRTTLAAAAFYDSAKTFISCVKAEGTDNVLMEEALAIPDGAAFVRFSFHSAFADEYAIVTNTDIVTVDVLKLDQTVREHDTASVSMDYAALVSQAAKAAYINTAGTLEATEAWVTSGLIRVNSACRIDYALYATASTCPIAFYDRNGVFLSGLTAADSGVRSGAGLMPPEGACYLRCCALNSGSYTDQFITITYKRVDTLEAELEWLWAENPLWGKVMTATGDSITATTASRPYAGYARMIAAENQMTYESKAIWGATIADGVSGSSGCILTTLTSMREDADYVILSGGANDFYRLSSGDETLGEISDGYTAALDTGTFCGALESMCKTAISRWPGKKILYVLTHRMTDIGSGDLESWVEKMTVILRKWGIPYVDLWHDMPSLMLPALKDLYTTNGNTVYEGTGDGLHPNEDGYRRYYVPRVEAKLKTI